MGPIDCRRHRDNPMNSEQYASNFFSAREQPEPCAQPAPFIGNLGRYVQVISSLSGHLKIPAWSHTHGPVPANHTKWLH